MVNDPCCFPTGSVLPDYAGGGLPALMHQVTRFLDGGLFSLPGVDSALTTVSSDASDRQVVVLFLVDGLGDEFLCRYGQGSRLHAHRAGNLTSVCPSTTATAVTTVLTGLTPAQHGLTGWFIFDPRFGGVIAPLPMRVREGEAIEHPLASRRLFAYPSLFQRRRRHSVMLNPAGLVDSPYSRRHGRGASMRGYQDLQDLVAKIRQACHELSAKGGGLVYAYFPDFDAISHDQGTQSSAAQSCFEEVDQAFAALLEDLGAGSVDVVVTADHGFIDSPPERRLELESRPDLCAMLTAPLFGERRFAFCNVRAGAEQAFVAAASEWLGERATVCSSRALLERGLFGPGKPHPRLKERVGTHALIMADNWTFMDRVNHAPHHQMLGVHGGLSSAEMLIPLIHCRVD